MLDKMTIIYNTCDNYSFLWNNFFILFDKYWPNCKNKIVLNTENKEFTFKSLNIVKTKSMNSTCSWSQRLLNSLDCVDTPYVLMILDDFYLKSSVKLDVLSKCIEYMDSDNKIVNFVFGWQPGPNYKCFFSDDFELRGRFSKYRVNAQIGLWRVDYLKKILRTYESPWQFELSGSFRSSLYGGKFYSLKKDSTLVFDYDWGFLIIRGKINKEIANYFIEKENLNMDYGLVEYRKEEIPLSKYERLKNYSRYFFDMIISIIRK